MKRRLPWILLLTFGALLVFGLLQLVRLRYEAGDVYPPYSSLRADPLGTMAFYESLERLPGFAVHRDFSTENRLPAHRSAAYLHIAARGFNWRWMPEELFDEAERFANAGGRLVITFHPEPGKAFRIGNWEYTPPTNSPPAPAPAPTPQTQPPAPAPQDPAAPGESESPEKLPITPKRKRPEPREPLAGEQMVSIMEQWKIGFDLRDLVAGEDYRYAPAEVRRIANLPLPDALQWHSGIVITNLATNSAWTTIYARNNDPVVIERRFGRGSIVIATDSYLLSNEAMHRDRHAELLAWIVGPHREVWFDEAHLGVTEQPGMATLLRKYRLYWVIGALVVLALLFIWKNAVSLLPRRAGDAGSTWIEGRDSTSGFVNLLRRTIPAEQLLPTCFAEWKRTVAPGGRYSAARREQAETVFALEVALPPKQRNPVRAYQQIHSALENRPSNTIQTTREPSDTSTPIAS